MRREWRESFSRHRGLAIPTCITTRAWLTCGDACQGCLLTVFFEVGGGENVPGIPGACATRNSTYLVIGPWPRSKQQIHCINTTIPTNHCLCCLRANDWYHCILWSLNPQNRLKTFNKQIRLIELQRRKDARYDKHKNTKPSEAEVVYGIAIYV